MKRKEREALGVRGWGPAPFLLLVPRRRIPILPLRTTPYHSVDYSLGAGGGTTPLDISFQEGISTSKVQSGSCLAWLGLVTQVPTLLLHLLSLTPVVDRLNININIDTNTTIDPQSHEHRPIFYLSFFPLLLPFAFCLFSVPLLS